MSEIHNACNDLVLKYREQVQEKDQQIVERYHKLADLEQALYLSDQQVAEQRRVIEALQHDKATANCRISDLEQQNADLTQENARLRERNTQLETYLRETVEPYKYFDGMAWCWPFDGRTPQTPAASHEAKT